MNLDNFGMDTITFAGPLEGKLNAIRDAGFTQVMLSAPDLVGHPGGEDAALAAVRAAACASPDSRSCAISRACRATCTPTRST